MLTHPCGGLHCSDGSLGVTEDTGDPGLQEVLPPCSGLSQASLRLDALLLGPCPFALTSAAANPAGSLSPRVTVTPGSQTLGSQSPRVTPSWSRSPRPSLNTLPCAAVTSLPASQGLPSALGSERIRQLRNSVWKKPNNQLLLQTTSPDRKQIELLADKSLF